MTNIEALIDKATNKNNINEDWGTIMELCDVANSNARDTVNYLKKKITDKNNNVVLYSLTVADSLVKNCGKKVHKEISSRGFLDIIVKQINNKNTSPIVRQKMLFCIKEWNNAFGNNPSLSYCNEIYNKLKNQNYTFDDPYQKNNRRNDEEINNARLKRKEEEELQLALALSLSAEESKKNNKKSSSSSKEKFGSPSTSSPVQPPSSQNKSLFKVKALYDFVGNYAEGELPLYAGDIINVYDTTYKDWWKGENRGMIGIFPNNYVEKIQESTSNQQVDGEYETQVLKEAQKIDEFMQILARVDIKTENLSENDELQNLYNSICTLRPKLVKLVEFYSKKMEEINLLNTKSYQAQEIYRNLYEQQQQQQQQLYAPIQQPYAPYAQPQPQPQPYLPQQPPTNYMMPMPSTQPPLNSAPSQEILPPQSNLPTTPPGKVPYDPRLVQQPPQQQPQQPLYMQPYVNQGVPPPNPMDPGVAAYQNPSMPMPMPPTQPPY